MKLLNTGKAEMLAVKVPDGAREYKVFNDDKPYLSFFESHTTPRVYLLDGNKYTVLGLADQLTEEQLQDIFPVPAIKPVYGHPFGAVPASLTWEHFRRDHKLYTKNPYIIEHPKWRQAEENTGNWLILKADKI